jgi:tetratricopeptide (TPR) repeat protein
MTADNAQAGARAGPDPAADRLCAEGLALHGRGDFAAAAACFERALALSPSLAEAHNHLGRSLNNLRRLDVAERAFREALILRPGYAEAHNNLGHVLRAQGRHDAAAAAFRAAIDSEPGFARAHHNLGTVRNAQARFEDAADCFRRGLAIEPADAAGWTNLGDVLHVLERHDEAVETYRRAISVDSGYADAHANLGSLLQGQSRLVEAEAAYRDALAQAPAHATALAGLAGIMEVKGKPADALALIEPALAAEPDKEALVIAHARLLRRLGRHAEAIERLEALLAAGRDTLAQRARVHFVLGDLNDDLGAHDRAFAHFRTANAAKRPMFDPATFIHGVESLIEYFTKERLAALPRSGSATERPVFIVGMPRSGTSLVEQILAAHSAVHACGERTDLYALARDLSARLGSRLPYPDCLRDATAARLAEFAGEYLAASGAPDTALRMTDKLPANFLNLGLIELLFPQARVIHCRRHPLDTALSCYFQHFASRGQAFADRLEHIGVYMRLYRRIMAHWRAVTGLPMLEVDYEALVAEPEAVTRRMVAFLGLDWQPACLRFHELERLVVTASYAQVREPVYSRSVGRYRAYERYLEPVKSALGEDHAAP